LRVIAYSEKEGDTGSKKGETRGTWIHGKLESQAHLAQSQLGNEGCNVVEGTRNKWGGRNGKGKKAGWQNKEKMGEFYHPTIVCRVPNEIPARRFGFKISKRNKQRPLRELAQKLSVVMEVLRKLAGAKN